MLEKEKIAKINYLAFDEFMALASAKIARARGDKLPPKVTLAVDIEEFHLRKYLCDNGIITPCDSASHANVRIKLINVDHFIGLLNGKRLPIYVRGIRYYKAFNSYYIAILDEIKDNLLLQDIALEDIDNVCEYIFAIYRAALKTRFGSSKVELANYNIIVCVCEISNIDDNTIGVCFKTKQDMIDFYNGKLSLEFAENKEIAIACNADIKEEVFKILRETNISMFM